MGVLVARTSHRSGEDLEGDSSEEVGVARTLLDPPMLELRLVPCVERL